MNKSEFNEPYVPNAPPPYPGVDAPPAQPYMPPPAAGYPPLPPGSTGYSYPAMTGPYHGAVPGTTTVVSAAPAVTVVTVQTFSPYPIHMQCPKCNAQITTSIKPTTGTLTWLVAGGLCLLGCWLGCCLIPFCMDGCQDIEHFCPNCKAHLGTYRRL